MDVSARRSVAVIAACAARLAGPLGRPGGRWHRLAVVGAVGWLLVGLATSSRGVLVAAGHDVRIEASVIGLRVPRAVITAKTAPYLKHGKPWHRPELMNLDDPEIISAYGAGYRGLAQYYLLAGNVSRLHRLRWAAETSMLKTLVAKHRSTVTKMARKYKAVTITRHGPRTCFEARTERPGRKPLAARFGGIALKRHKKAVLDDRLPVLPSARRKELVTRLLRGRCEWCQQRCPVQVHQVRKLADLGTPGSVQPGWASLMARMRRKSLIVCAACHQLIHDGKPTVICTS